MTTPSPYKNLITIYKQLIDARKDLIIKQISPITSIDEIIKKWNEIIQLQCAIKYWENHIHDENT
jgi:predicted membrane protein